MESVHFSKDGLSDTVLLSDEPPSKRLRLEEPVVLISKVKPFTAYLCQKEIVLAYSTLQKEIDNRVLIENLYPHYAPLDLAAMSGHMLGATSTLTPSDFAEKANQLVRHFNGDKVQVGNFFHQARQARYIMEADYVMTVLPMPNGVCVNPDGGKKTVRPTHSASAFFARIGDYEGLCDQSEWVFKYKDYGKRTDQGSLSKSNDSKRLIRGGTLMVVIQLIIVFLGQKYVADTDTSLLLGGYSSSISSRVRGLPASANHRSIISTIPKLKLGDNPVSLETLFARTELSLTSASKKSSNRNLIANGAAPIIHPYDAIAWKTDEKLSHCLCDSLMKSGVQKQKRPERVATLYECNEIGITQSPNYDYGCLTGHSNAAINKQFTKPLEEYFGRHGVGRSQEFSSKNIIGKGSVEFFRIRYRYQVTRTTGILQTMVYQRKQVM